MRLFRILRYPVLNTIIVPVRLVIASLDGFTENSWKHLSLPCDDGLKQINDRDHCAYHIW